MGIYPRQNSKHSFLRFKHSFLRFKHSSLRFKHSFLRFKHSTPRFKHSFPRFKYSFPRFKHSTLRFKHPNSLSVGKNIDRQTRRWSAKTSIGKLVVDRQKHRWANSSSIGKYIDVRSLALAHRSEYRSLVMNVIQNGVLRTRGYVYVEGERWFYVFIFCCCFLPTSNGISCQLNSLLFGSSMSKFLDF